MPDPDAILFDFDGVLADSEPVHRGCWNEVLACFGIHLDWEFYCQHCIGVDDRKMMQVIAAQSDPPVEWETIWERYPVKKELFRSRMLAAPPFAPWLADFLRHLSAKYKLAIVSSSGRTEIEPLLVSVGLRGCFSALVFGREAERMKPAPEPYLLAAKLLEAKAPLVVEDSPSGIASGRAAGFEVLEVSSPGDLQRLLTRRLGNGLGRQA